MTVEVGLLAAALVVMVSQAWYIRVLAQRAEAWRLKCRAVGRRLDEKRREIGQLKARLKLRAVGK